MIEQSRTITISLSPILQMRLNARIAQRGTSRSEYLRILIEPDLEGESLTSQVETGSVSSSSASRRCSSINPTASFAGSSTHPSRTLAATPRTGV